MDTLNVVHWNAQSILHNRYEFTNFLYKEHIHIAIICETWLKPHLRLKIPGFNIERNDCGNKHNGVCILIHNSIAYNKINTFFDDSLQNICIQISVNGKQISIVSFYSPTNCNPAFDKTKFENLIKSIPEPMIIAGDFNAHHTSWGCCSTSPRGRTVLDVVDDNFLVLLNDGTPTTVGSVTWRPNALDLAIVSPSLAPLCTWSVHDDPLGSYHLPGVINLVFNNNVNNFVNNNANGTHLPIHPNFKMVNWQMYSKKVECMVNNFQFDSYTPLEAYNLFTTILISAASQSILNHKSPPTNNFSRPSVGRFKKVPNLPWWNDKCSAAVQNSKQAYIKFKQNFTLENYLEFKKLQAIKKLVLKNERQNSWADLCNSFNRFTPLSVIWRFMRKFNKTYVPRHFDGNHEWILDFLQKYTPDSVANASSLPIDSSPNSHNNYLINLFTLEELKSAINSRRDTSFGLDGIPYMLFKKLPESCLIILLNIYNALWTRNDIPPEWKTDCIIPILKSDKPRFNPESYRPITLTSCAGKVFEQLLKQRLEYYVEHNALLPKNQYGFRRGRSARESISMFHLDILKSVNSNNKLISVFFDITGAFNNVNIDILCTELLNICIPIKVVQWIQKFLSGRKVFVKYNGGLFGPRLSSIGVCQGGILSPLFFILYIRRLNLIMGPNIKNLQFADDLVVYLSGNNSNIIINNINLALTKLHSYLSYLNLEVNPSKSKVVVFGQKFTANLPSLMYNNIPLPIVLDTKFLGVIFCHNLSWKKYADYLVAKANKAFNILKSLRGTNWGADPKILLMLYKSLVRSHFEYGFMCFASDHKIIEILEKIQNKCMRVVTGALKTTPIVSLQVECNLPPVAIRIAYLKERFVLKLHAENGNPLLNQLLNSNILYIQKSFYTLQGLSEFTSYLKQINIHKSNDHLPCFDGPYESKFSPINVVIDNNLSRKEQVYEKLASWNEFKFIYTDGSKNESSVSSAVYDPENKMGLGFKITKHASIFTAEAFAILCALKHISRQNKGSCKWVIVSDSMSVLKALQNNKTKSDTNYLIFLIKDLWFELYLKKKFVVEFMWTPSHIGVSGNENVDFLARSISDSPQSVDVSFDVLLPYTDAIAILKQRMYIQWKKHWDHVVQQENKGCWYAALHVNLQSKPWFCKGNIYRKTNFYSIICRLRFGHCRLNHHLYRMKIVSDPLCQLCQSNEDQTIDHIIFYCSSFGIQRLVLMDELIRIYGEPHLVPRSVPELLKNHSVYEPLYNFIVSTVKEI